MMVIINIIFIFIRINYIRTVFMPKYAVEYKYPFLLPYSDGENYYLITSTKRLKINIENGNIDDYIFPSYIHYSENGVFCKNKFDDSCIYDSQMLYPINGLNPVLNIQDSYDVDYNGCLNLSYSFLIYGIKAGNLAIIHKNKHENHYYRHEINIKISQKFSLKFITNDKFICVFIDNDNKIKIYFLNEHNDNEHTLKKINFDYKQYINLALYDTTKEPKTKILCGQDEANTIICSFFTIIFNNDNTISGGRIVANGSQNLTFNSEDSYFNEKDCCFSEFNNEYLFCCGVKNFIICYRLDYNYDIIKQFNISIEGRNSYLSMITNNLNATFFFMNEDKKVYVYKIFLPNIFTKLY